MPRNMRANETQRRSKARREIALGRSEMGQPTSARVSAAGVTAMAVKARDATDDLLIEAFLRSKGEGR